MTAVRWLLWKDVLTETRGWERISTLAVFAAAVMLTFHFTLPVSSTARPAASAGFLWATVVFAALLELRRSLSAERRDATLDGLRAAPITPATLFWGKLLSSFAVLAVLEAILVPVTALFFGGRMAGVPAAYGVCLAATLGLLAWGTLFAALSSGTRSGEVVLAIFLFPLVVPQTIACVRLVGHLLAGAEIDSLVSPLVVLAAFDLISLGTSLLLFDYALDG